MNHSISIMEMFGEHVPNSVDKSWRRDVKYCLECLDSGHLYLFHERSVELVEELKQRDELTLISAMTRVLFKRLALSPLAGLPRDQQDILFYLAYDLHRLSNEILFERSPPRPLHEDLLKIIDDCAKRLAPSHKPTVVLFVTKRYVPNLDLWVSSLPTEAISKVRCVLICIDDCFSECSALLENTSLDLTMLDLSGKGRFTLVGSTKDLYFLWYVKVLAISRFVFGGHDVIYSDLDAFWLDDVVSHLERSLGEYDVAFMTADHMPPVSRIRYGKTLGCGFIHSTSTKGAKSFLEGWLRSTAIMLDDQIGLYHHVENNVGLLIDSEKDLISHLAFIPIGESKTRMVKIGVFGSQFARRSAHVSNLMDLKSKPIVFHPRWINDPEKTRDDYLSILRGA